MFEITKINQWNNCASHVVLNERFFFTFPTKFRIRILKKNKHFTKHTRKIKEAERSFNFHFKHLRPWNSILKFSCLNTGSLWLFTARCLLWQEKITSGDSALGFFSDRSFTSIANRSWLWYEWWHWELIYNEMIRARRMLVCVCLTGHTPHT